MIESDIEPVAKLLYNKIGRYDRCNGPAIMNLDQISKQKNDERYFAAVIQCWLRQLLFGKEKELVDSNYLDLSTFHYPNQNDYLDFIALQEGSIDRQKNLTLKEITILILLVLECIRIGSQLM